MTAARPRAHHRMHINTVSHKPRAIYSTSHIQQHTAYLNDIMFADIPMTVRPTNATAAAATCAAAAAAAAGTSPSAGKAKGEPPPSYTTLQQRSPCGHHQQQQQHLHQSDGGSTSTAATASTTASGCDVVYKQQQQQVRHPQTIGPFARYTLCAWVGGMWVGRLLFCALLAR